MPLASARQHPEKRCCIARFARRVVQAPAVRHWKFSWLPVGAASANKPAVASLVDLSRIPNGVFPPGRSILARKWPAKMTKTKQTDNENFQSLKPWRIVAIRNWGGAVRSDPTHSSELRRASWLTFDAAFGAGWSTFTPGAARALVSLVSIAE